LACSSGVGPEAPAVLSDRRRGPNGILGYPGLNALSVKASICRQGSGIQKPLQSRTLQEPRDELARTRPAWQVAPQELEGFLAGRQIPGETRIRSRLGQSRTVVLLPSTW
jgi:hypothetical protein